MSRTGQLLRRFQLPPQATQAELKKAYLKRAKEVHPDVAGKSGEQQFRRLKEEYEEAMTLLREGERYSGDRWKAQGGQTYPKGRDWREQGQDWSAFYQYQAYQHQQAASGSRAQPQPPPDPWTPAQRLRNVVLVAGGIVSAAFLFSMGSGSGGARGSRPPNGHRAASDGGVGQAVPTAAFAAVAVGAASAIGASTEVASAATESQAVAGGGGTATPRSTAPPPPHEVVSDYYKKRTAKSTVRVRGGDAYVSPAAAPKSRAVEEGFGSGVTSMANVARGFSPSEGTKEKQAAPPVAAPAAVVADAPSSSAALGDKMQ